MQGNEADKGISLLFRGLNTTIQAANTFSNILFQALKFYDRDIVARQLRKDLGKGEAEFATCDPNSINKLSRCLDESGVSYFRGYYGGQGIFIISKAQHEKAQEALAMYRSEMMKGGIVTPEIVHAWSEGSTLEINGLGLEEAMLYSKRCADRGVRITVDQPGDDEFSIRFAECDRPRMERVKLDVAAELSGPAGDLARQQLAYENRSFMNIYDAARQDMGEKMYVVDRQGATMELGKYVVSVSGKDEEGYDYSRKLNRNDKKFDDRLMVELGVMKGSVLLDQKQYENYMSLETPEQKEDFLINREREAGRPHLTAQEMEILAKASKSRELVEQKLAQDNPDAARIPYSPINDEQSFYGFKESEKVNWEAVHDKAEAEHPDAVILDDARALNEGWVFEEPKLEYESEQVEERIIGDRVEEVDMDLTQDLGREDLDLDYVSDLDNLEIGGD